MAQNNPWDVETIRAFYYLQCPECPFDTKEEKTFVTHATENHPSSCTFFDKKYANEILMKNATINAIKSEPISDNDRYEDFTEFYPEVSMNEDTEDGFKKKKIKKVHEGKKPFPCSFCGSSYTRKTALNKHVKTVHVDMNDQEEETPYQGNLLKGIVI